MPRHAPAAIALMTMILACAGVLEGHGAAILPLGLAFAAMLGALVVGMAQLAQGQARSGGGLVLAALLAALPLGLLGCNLALLALVARFQPDAAVALISPYAQIGLLSLMLAGWVWQQGAAHGAMRLPTALHARLIHAANPTL